MKCMKCNKNEANVYYCENINGKQSETYLCSDCAEKVGLKMRVPSFSESRFGRFFEDPFFSEKGVFGGMLDMMRDFDKSFFNEDFFKPLLSDGSEKTAGKKERKCSEKASAACETEKTAKPEKKETVSPRNELQSLRRELKKAVAAEEYENAAVIRDKIRALEKKSA